MTARRGRHIFLHNAIEEPVPRQRITGLEGTIVLLYAHSIDVQKMNWKVRTGVQEQTGVCLHRHYDHHGTGGYTHEPQNTGQCCDCQSLTCQVAPGLPPRRCAVGTTDHGVARPPGAPGAYGGPVRALGSQFLLSLRLAAGLSAARLGEFALPP